MTRSSLIVDTGITQTEALLVFIEIECGYHDSQLYWRLVVGNFPIVFRLKTMTHKRIIWLPYNHIQVKLLNVHATPTPVHTKGTGRLVVVKDQYSHFGVSQHMHQITNLWKNWNKILCVLSDSGLKYFNLFKDFYLKVGNCSCLENYVTSEGAVSHNVF